MRKNRTLYIPRVIALFKHVPWPVGLAALLVALAADATHALDVKRRAASHTKRGPVSTHASHPHNRSKPTQLKPVTGNDHAADGFARQRDARDHSADTISDATRYAKGLYITGPYAHRFGANGVADVVRGAKHTAAVIDLKDDQGRVTYPTAVEILQPQRRNFIKDLHHFVATLKKRGIYTIARIVCFNDAQLPARHPEVAVLDTRPRRAGQPWTSWGTGTTWLDPYNTANHDMILALIHEARAADFDEVQLDYIRFPVDDGTQFANFPASAKPENAGLERRELLRRFLARVDRELDRPLSVDVFGLTALNVGDPSGLGQDLELWAPHVEAFSPMLYVNAMQGWMPQAPLEERAERLVKRAVYTLRQRVGAESVIRPFLQAFPNGWPSYDPQFITQQVQGALRGGADGLLWWSPGSKYSVVTQAARGQAASALSALGTRRGVVADDGRVAANESQK